MGLRLKFNKGRAMDIGCLDFSKAFDKGLHVKLVQKVRSVCILGSHTWIRYSL